MLAPVWLLGFLVVIVKMPSGTSLSVAVQYHWEIGTLGIEAGRYIFRVNRQTPHGSLCDRWGTTTIGGGHAEQHRLSDTVTVHRVGEFETDVDGRSVLGTFLNFNRSVVAWDESGGDWKRWNPLLKTGTKTLKPIGTNVMLLMRP